MARGREGGSGVDAHSLRSPDRQVCLSNLQNVVAGFTNRSNYLGQNAPLAQLAT